MVSNQHNFKKVLFSVGVELWEGRFKHLTSPRFQEYAQYYGFEYRAISEYENLQGRTPHWIKIHYILKLLKELKSGDLIVYLDADIVIVRGDIELATSKSISFAKSSSGNVNSGVIVVRVNEFSQEFFQAVWDRKDCDNHKLQDNLAVLKVLDKLSEQEKEQHLEILPNCLNVTLVKGEYSPYDKYLTNPCQEPIRFRHFASMQPLYQKYFSRPVIFTEEDESQVNSSVTVEISGLPFNLKPINLIVFPDWSQSEEDLYLQLKQCFVILTNHYDKNQISLLINTDGIAEEEGNLFLSSVVFNLLMEENIDVTESLEILEVRDLEPYQWQILLFHVHTQIVLGTREREAQNLLSLNLKPEWFTSCPVNELNKFRAGDFFFNLGNKLFQQGQWQEAVQEYQKLLDFQIGDAELYWRLNECLAKIGQVNEAIKALSLGINLYPRDGKLHFTIINTLRVQGYIEEAISKAEAAVELLPDDYTFKLLKYLLLPSIYDKATDISYYRQRYISGLQELIEQTKLETPQQKQEALAGVSRLTNFYLAYQTQNDVELQTQYGNLVHRIMGANYPQWVEEKTSPPVQENQKIRIGYVSAYLHSYSGTLWLTGWLRYCDRNQFTIHCYYTGNSSDAVTEQFKEYSDIFHHIPHNLEATCQQIVDDKLHILIYPEIGMDAPTMAMAGLRLAPKQCVAWGHPVTTGLPTIDYFLSSELMEAKNAQEHYSENLIRLPNIGVAYPQPYIPPVSKTRADYDLEEEAVIYLCCQAPFKYLPQYDYIFPAIAQSVPQARFLFLRGELLKPRLKRTFAKVDLDYGDYCLFRKILGRSNYLNINLLSDIYLDTITWSGGNTSLEAIACNLPIVTLPTEFMRGRHTDSFLKMIKVTETIAKTEEKYIEIAVKLGLNSALRAAIQERVNQHKNRLFDDKNCIQGLEDFYQQIVAKHDF